MLKRDRREGNKLAHSINPGKAAPLAILCRVSVAQGFVPEPRGLWGQLTSTFQLFLVFLR